jgi:NAD(P)-dependent dehydrogenase (short-subunit alcohol dehydrogenase family)
MDLANKVIVVTGGGNGIGQQVVLELTRREARVAAVDIREDSPVRDVGSGRRW